jgi:glycosyltransferase involved in cell wall biosynthesis
MRVAVNGWFWDQPNTGSGQYVRNLLPAMLDLEAELEVTLVTPRPVSDALARVRLRVVRPRLGDHLGKVWFEQRAFAAACAGADLIHVPYWGPPLRAPVPLVVTVHDIIPLVLPEYRGGLLARAYTALVRAATHGAALVLTDSEASRGDILAHLGLPAGQVRTIYLAAGRAFVPAGDDTQDEIVRRKYVVPEKFVLYLGGFDARKNVRTLLRAYADVRHEIGDTIPLVLAGRELAGADARFLSLRSHIEGLGIAECVYFIGSVDEADKPALMRMASCFVFPSRYEGFGLPPLEAMACGTPVVGVDASSMPEVVGNAGYLVEPDDARAMAGAILSILTQEELAATLSERGLTQAGRFSWERTARQTLAAYAESLGGKPG